MPSCDVVSETFASLSSVVEFRRLYLAKCHCTKRVYRIDLIEFVFTSMRMSRGKYWWMDFIGEVLIGKEIANYLSSDLLLLLLLGPARERENLVAHISSARVSLDMLDPALFGIHRPRSI